MCSGHERGMGKKCKRSSLPNPQISSKEGQELLQVPKERFPYSAKRRPCQTRLSPWSSGSIWRRYSHCRAWGTPCWSRWTHPDGSCSPWRAQSGAGSWQSCDPWRAAYTVPDVLAVVTHGGPMLEKSISKGLCPVERTMLKQFLKNCVSCGKSWKRLYCVGGILYWSKEKEWGGKSGRDEVLWLNYKPQSPSLLLCTAVGRGGGVSNKVKPGKKEWWGEDGFILGFYFWFLFLTIYLLLAIN